MTFNDKWKRMTGEVKAVCPPRFTEFGVYIPTDDEMDNCTYAKDDSVVCPRKQGQKTGPMGGKLHLITCAECSHHPMNKPIKH